MTTPRPENLARSVLEGTDLAQLLETPSTQAYEKAMASFEACQTEGKKSLGDLLRNESTKLSAPVKVILVKLLSGVDKPRMSVRNLFRKLAEDDKQNVSVRKAALSAFSRVGRAYSVRDTILDLWAKNTELRPHIGRCLLVAMNRFTGDEYKQLSRNFQRLLAQKPQNPGLNRRLEALGRQYDRLRLTGPLIQTSTIVSRTEDPQRDLVQAGLIKGLNPIRVIEEAPGNTSTAKELFNGVYDELLEIRSGLGVGEYRDHPPFKVLWEALSERMQTIARSIDKDEAEDIAQYALMELSKRLEKAETLDNPNGFAYRVARNRFVDMLRKKRESALGERPVGEEGSVDRVDLAELKERVRFWLFEESFQAEEGWKPCFTKADRKALFLRCLETGFKGPFKLPRKQYAPLMKSSRGTLDNLISEGKPALKRLQQRFESAFDVKAAPSFRRWVVELIVKHMRENKDHRSLDWCESLWKALVLCLEKRLKTETEHTKIVGLEDRLEDLEFLAIALGFERNLSSAATEDSKSHPFDG